LLSIILITCDDEPKKAEIVIYSEPDPISQDTESHGLSYWETIIYLKEKAGVGAHIIKWEGEIYHTNGEFIEYYSLDVNDFINWFDYCFKEPTVIKI